MSIKSKIAKSLLWLRFQYGTHKTGILYMLFVTALGSCFGSFGVKSYYDNPTVLTWFGAIGKMALGWIAFWICFFLLAWIIGKIYEGYLNLLVSIMSWAERNKGE